MKIGIDARMINATGIGRYTKSLIEGLELLDKVNTYYIFLKEEDFSKIHFKNKNFIKVLADFHWYGLSEQIKFPKLLKKYNLDLVHFPHFNVPIFYRGNFVVTIHDLTLHQHKTKDASTKNFIIYELKHLLYKLIISKAIKKSLAIFSPSEFTKKDILNRFDVDHRKIYVTLEGGPSENLKNAKVNNDIMNKLGVEKGKYVLYVGNAYPHKNLNSLLKSSTSINKDLSIVFAGKEDNFYKVLKEKAKKLDKGRVIFSGFVKDDELVSLYKNALCYVFPSFNEGFGLPPLEAMSFGLPVISSNTSSLPEVLGDAALYFDPNNSNKLSELINKIYQDKRLAEELKGKGLKRVPIFSWDKMARETLDIYNNLLK